MKLVIDWRSAEEVPYGYIEIMKVYEDGSKWPIAYLDSDLSPKSIRNATKLFARSLEIEKIEEIKK